MTDISMKIISIICLILGAECLSRHPKLLLISFDGFRHDLIDRDLVPNIEKWASMSTWFKQGVKSQYVTYTAPNHMSIATGLYEEHHGIVGNYFFDSATNKLFDYFNSTQKEGVVEESQAEFWYTADPIWLTNERWESSRKSAALYWPNGDSPFPYLPHKPKHFKSWKTYGTLQDWMKDADEVIELFTRKEQPMNFVAWYIAEPDHVLHTNGFKNGELKKKLAELDELFLYFMKKFDDNDLGSEVNIILTADHGHAEIEDEKHVMCVPDYVKGEGFEMGDHMIYPHSEELAKEIYRNLTEAVKTHGFKVNIHWKEDIPSRFHYSNSSRIGRIIFEPEIGSAISFSCKKENMTKTYGPDGTVHFNASTHGMDPDRSEMRAMLVMRGPAFSENLTISEIPSNIDLYGLMCHVLNITASPNDGSMEIVKKALKENRYMAQSGFLGGYGFNVATDSMGFIFILGPSMCIVILFLVYGCRHTVMKNDPNWGRSDTAQGYRPLNDRTNNGFDIGDEDDEDGFIEEDRRRNGGGSLGGSQLNTGTVTMSGLLDEMSDDDI